MKNPKNDNSTVIKLNRDPREETLSQALEDLVYERGKGLTVNSIVGILYILADTLRKQNGIDF